MRSLTRIIALIVLYTVCSSVGFTHPLAATDTIPKINISTTSVSFGTCAVGSSKTVHITITNTSDTAVVLMGQVDSIGAPFSLDTNAGAFSLDSGRSRTFALTFHPFSPVSFVDSLIITSNADSANNRKVIYISGTGFIPDTVPQISVSPLILNWGIVYTGQTPSLQFTIKNITNQKMLLSGTVLNTHIPFGVTVGLGNFVLDSGRSENVIVQIEPTDTGTYLDSVVITSNTTGVKKRIVVLLMANVHSSNELLPQINLQTYTIEFGTMRYNIGLNLQVSFTVKNISDSDRTLIVNVLPPNTPYSLNGPTNHLTLNKNGSQDYTVFFSPKAPGEYRDSIIVISNAPNSRIPIYVHANALSNASVSAGSQSEVTVSVYPNPATDRVQVQYTGGTGNVGECNLYDLTGKCILSGQGKSGSSELELDTHSLPSGHYNGRVFVNGAPHVFDLVISR